MTKSAFKLMAGLVMAGALTLPLDADARPPERQGGAYQERRQDTRQNVEKIIPYGQVAREVSRSYGGRVVGQEVLRQGGRAIYALRVLRKDGRVVFVKVDAQSGAIIEARGE